MTASQKPWLLIANVAWDHGQEKMVDCGGRRAINEIIRMEGQSDHDFHGKMKSKCLWFVPSRTQHRLR